MIILDDGSEGLPKGGESSLTQQLFSSLSSTAAAAAAAAAATPSTLTKSPLLPYRFHDKSDKIPVLQKFR